MDFKCEEFVKTLTPKIDLTGTGSCAAFNLRRTSWAVTALYDAGLTTSGLRSTQVTILIAIAKSEPVLVGALAKILLAKHTTLPRNLALLSREGLVFVSTRSTMRRRLVSSLKGTAALTRSVSQWRKTQAHFVGSFGEPRWKETQKALEDLAAIAVRLNSR
jgi:DNA-binding MarR family transcriptional regulator